MLLTSRAWLPSANQWPACLVQGFYLSEGLTETLNLSKPRNAKFSSIRELFKFSWFEDFQILVHWTKSLKISKLFICYRVICIVVIKFQQSSTCRIKNCYLNVAVGKILWNLAAIYLDQVCRRKYWTFLGVLSTCEWQQVSECFYKKTFN